MVWPNISLFYTCQFSWKLISSNSQNSGLRCPARLNPLVIIRPVLNFLTGKNFKTQPGWKFWNLSVENESHNEGLRLKYQAKRNWLDPKLLWNFGFQRNNFFEILKTVVILIAKALQIYENFEDWKFLITLVGISWYRISQDLYKIFISTKSIQTKLW